MEMRNVRRSYLIGKALRVWRKKKGMGRIVEPVGLHYLYCLYFYGGWRKAGYLKDLLTKDGICPYDPSLVHKNLAALVKLGLVKVNEDKAYSITAAGKSALNEIEQHARKCVPGK